MRYSPISRRILKIMDPKISDAFFDFEMKPRPPNLVKAQIQDSKVSKSPKLEAGLMIAKHLEDYSCRRRKTVQDSKMLVDNSKTSQKFEQNSHDVVDYSILSEKQLLKTINQEPHTPTIAIELNEISPSKINSLSNTRIAPQQNKQLTFKISHSSSSKWERHKANTPPILAFPKASADKAYFDYSGST